MNHGPGGMEQPGADSNPASRQKAGASTKPAWFDPLTALQQGLPHQMMVTCTLLSMIPVAMA